MSNEVFIDSGNGFNWSAIPSAKSNKIKIIEITEEYIKFDNGDLITFDHEQDCCEVNYADFEQIDDLARNYQFDEKLIFQGLEDMGFMFGDSKRMFFVPCYSDQNGYYTSEIEIYFNGEKVLTFNAELREY